MTINIKRFLVCFTLFIAPSGMFYTPIEAVGSFRLFYLACLAINIYAVFGLARRQLLDLSILLSICSLMVASAAYGLFRYRPEILGAADNPLVRALVIANLMFGFYFIGKYLSEISKDTDINKILDKAFFGFLVVFSLGLAIYLGVVLGAIPQIVYTHFVSLEQTGYGYLRLSPGTYPNEFGILCSFFSAYALIKYSYEKQRWAVGIMSFFVIGMFLTSTRAAYATFFAAILTILVLHPSLRLKFKITVSLLVGAVVVITALNAIGFDVVGVVVSGYKAAMSMQTGSLATRREAWDTALDNLPKVIGLGVGFESPTASFLHNLPLQLLYGLGIWGVALISGLFALFFVSFHGSGWPRAPQNPSGLAQFRMVRLILLEHVVLFGLTNHNQAHFLTWLLFALYICRLRKSRSIELRARHEHLYANVHWDRTVPVSERLS